MSAPSLWAMMNSFKELDDRSKNRRELSRGHARVLSSFMTLIFLGGLSVEFFPAVPLLLATVLLCFCLLIFFRRKLSIYYRWLEVQFHSGFQSDLGQDSRNKNMERLAPWDAHLTQIEVPRDSSIIGKSLAELRLTEKYGLNIVVISRDGRDVVAPKASALIFPGDKLLCFATDVEVISSGQILKAK